MTKDRLVTAALALWYKAWGYSAVAVEVDGIEQVCRVLAHPPDYLQFVEVKRRGKTNYTMVLNSRSTYRYRWI